jgi:dolichyl-phosphate beta-glucosyltransferase
MRPLPDLAPEVSIIIPVYKGGRLLETHFIPFLQWLQSRPYTAEIILVDDGSPDRPVIQEFAAKQQLSFFGLPANQGKGAALRKGFAQARGAIQLFTDFDIPYQYADIDTLVSLLQQDPLQLAIGDRTDPRSTYFQKTGSLRNWGSNLVSWLVKRYFVESVRDSQCGLKGMGRKVAGTLLGDCRIDRFAMDLELIYLAKKKGVRLHKFPVQLRCNDVSNVRVARDGWRLLKDMYRIRKNHGKKRYE